MGKAIGLLVDNEADIPAVEAYAQSLKGGGGAVVAPVEVPATEATSVAVAPSPAQATGGEMPRTSLLERVSNVFSFLLLAGRIPWFRIP